MLQKFLVFVAMVSVGLAALSVRDLDPKPEKFKDVDGCYIREVDDVVPVGGRTPSRDPAKCEEYICNEKYVQVATCGAVGASDPCSVVAGDANAPYPGCCQTIYCPDNSDISCDK